MEKHSKNGRKSLKPLLDKDKRIIQENKVFDSFLATPKTMLEADIETSVMRSNICRYVGKWRKLKKVAVIRERYCTITGHLAGELTTNPALFPSRPKQGNLFASEGQNNG